MRKICFVTGSRAEFGILRPLMEAVRQDPALKLQLVATGTHYAPEFGSTASEIEASGFRIDKRVEALLSTDSHLGAAKSAGLTCLSVADAFYDLAPDVVVLLGDRFEILAVALAAVLLRMPIAHISGGDVTEGAIDDSMRHAITKLASLHFTTAAAFRQRVIQMGEAPATAFDVGSLSIDTIKSAKLMSKSELEKSLGLRFKSCNVLVTFHPVTTEPGQSLGQLDELIKALDQYPEAFALFTMANADPEGRLLNERLTATVRAWGPDRCAVFDSLGWHRYLSAIPLMSAVVGNSSSGLAEVPSFGIPTLNIGTRQKGRILASSVLSCPPEAEAIVAALTKAFSPEFKAVARQTKNPYGDGRAAPQILHVLKTVDLERLRVKRFCDVPAASVP